MAAVLTALQQQQRQQRQRRPCQQSQPLNAPAPIEQRAGGDQGSSHPATPQAAAVAPGLDETLRAVGPAETGGAVARAGTAEDAGCDFGFRFAILASGFPSPALQHRELLSEVGPLELPSLHVYGSAAAAADRQIPPRQSEELAAAFSCHGGQRRCLCHQCGHLIPATKSHVATFRAFLSQFL